MSERSSQRSTSEGSSASAIRFTATRAITTAAVS